MKYLLPLLFCIACAVLALSQPRQQGAIASAQPSPALLDAMNSHGIEVGTETVASEEAPVPAAGADAPQMQPALLLSGAAPAMQPAVYHGAAR